MKDLSESVSVTSYRTKYEAGRSFDLEDDMEFCPGLLTDDDVSSSLDELDHWPAPSPSRWH